MYRHNDRRKSFSYQCLFPIVVCLLSVQLSSCRLIQTFDEITEDYKTLQTNPKSFIGKYYEVEPDKKFVATKDFRTIINLKQEHKGIIWTSICLLQIKEFDKESPVSNIMENINLAVNANDSKTKLIFQIMDCYTGSVHNTILKIKVLNKRLSGTVWWITASELVGTANKIHRLSD